MDTLADIVARNGWALTSAHIEALDRYCQSLWALNAHLNLTRHLDYESFAARDLLDTLKLSELLAPEEAVLDIGSGGGVPGLVLAIIRPDLKITLTDSVHKKARALEQLAQQAGVHVEIYAARGEALLEDFRFDSAIARAVGPLDKILSWLSGSWDVLGRLLAVKGPRWPEEYAAAEKRGLWQGLTCRAVSEYEVPNLGWTSSILEIKRNRFD